jgi:Flp pilus assembly protein TadG
MVEFLAVASVLFLALLSLAQLSFLYAGKGAVETAAHFASRAFARAARANYPAARAEALRVAAEGCAKRPGGYSSTLSQTMVRMERDDGQAPRPAAGETWVVRLTHAFELSVPVAGPLLYALAPLPKVRIGTRFLLYLRSARAVTVE